MGGFLADRRAPADLPSLPPYQRWVPGRVVTVRGAFALIHKAEILNLVRHLELQEKREHPLHRIMQIEEKPDSIMIKTTDIHLPRSIGEALRHAYKGSLEFHYTAESYSVEVEWSREL
jgi:hypothetical protein